MMIESKPLALAFAAVLLSASGAGAQDKDAATPPPAASTATPESTPAAATPATAPTPLPSDARDAAVAVCMNKAKEVSAAKGATDVSLREVQDTDKKSHDRAAVRAVVDVTYADKNGKTKKKKQKFKCHTQNEIVTSFEYD